MVPAQIAEVILKLKQKMIKVPPTRSHNTPEDSYFNLGILEAISLLEQVEVESHILARIEEIEGKINVPIMPGDDCYAQGYNDHAQEMEHIKSKRIAELQSQLAREEQA